MNLMPWAYYAVYSLSDGGKQSAHLVVLLVLLTIKLCLAFALCSVKATSLKIHVLILHDT